MDIREPMIKSSVYLRETNILTLGKFGKYSRFLTKIMKILIFKKTRLNSSVILVERCITVGKV